MSNSNVRAAARINGSNAFSSGKTQRDNPYEAGTEEHAIWLAGWEAADFEVFSTNRLLAETNMSPRDNMVLKTQTWMRS